VQRLAALPRHVLHVGGGRLFPVARHGESHPLPDLLVLVGAGHRDLDPAVRGQAVLLLVPLVVVPVARRVAALLALVGLLPRVPQHVALQVHALVAAVVAHGALEGLGARVDPLVALQVGEVPAGVVAQVALVGLLARVHAVVPLEVVEVRRGVVALRALVRLLAAVSLHVARQVVGVVREEGAGGARVHLVAALAGAVGRGRRVLRQQLQGALGADLGRGAVLVLQDDAAQPAGVGEERRGHGGAVRHAPSGRPAAAAARAAAVWDVQQRGGLVAGRLVAGRTVAGRRVGGRRVGGRYGWWRRPLQAIKGRQVVIALGSQTQI